MIPTRRSMDQTTAGAAGFPSAWQSSAVGNTCSSCCTEPEWSCVTSSCSPASTILSSAFATKSLIVLRGHLASQKALAILQCSSRRMSSTLLYCSWIRSRLCELTRWGVCSSGTSSTGAAPEACKLLFALTRDFFKSFIPCSLVFTRSVSSWASLLSSSISRFFYAK